MPLRSDLADLIERHRLLDDSVKGRSEGRFLSDWNGRHPFVEEYLGAGLWDDARSRSEASKYLYFDNEPSVIEHIRELHARADGLALSPKQVMAGPGSSSLLAAMSVWLLQSNHREVFYVPPLYYSFHYFLRVLGITLRPASARHAFESGIRLNLPNRRSVLLVCDPIWYLGRSVAGDVMGEIREWQRRTSSIVLVDGSFQYMKWSGQQREESSTLDPELTFRLVCPTKSIGIPSFRFAYLLHPEWARSELLFLYENMVGAASVGDVSFSLRALGVLNSAFHNSKLTTFLRDTYRALVDRKLFRTDIDPDCGYFVFGKLASTDHEDVVMSGDYFELTGYDGYVRVNLMVAWQRYLATPDTGKS